MVSDAATKKSSGLGIVVGREVNNERALGREIPKTSFFDSNFSFLKGDALNHSLYGSELEVVESS